jgi:hypothetical protein
MVSPLAKHAFLKNLDASNITHRIVLENVQSAINEQFTQNNQARSSRLNFNYEGYNKLSSIENWIDDMQRDYPKYLTVFELGKSFEQRRIRGLKLSVPSAKIPKPAIFLEGGMHSREWLAPATVIYMTSLVRINARFKSS